MKAPLFLLLLISCALAAALPGVVHAQLLDATLSSASVIPPTGSPGSGGGNGMTNCSRDVLFDGTFWSLLSPPIAVEFHLGTANENGPLIHAITDLTAGAGGYYTFSEEFTLAPAMAESLCMGRVYLLVTTETFPNGEVRGQIAEHADPTKPTSWGSLKLLYR